MKFWAFDTETINRAGHGEACLLLKMTEKGVEYHEFPRDFDDVFQFLAGGRFLAWNADFDIRAIFNPTFADLDCVEHLALFGRASWGKYTFKYTPHKFFTCAVKGGGYFEIFDLRQFYGSSLEQAALDHLPEGLRKGSICKSWYNEMDKCLRDSRRHRVLEYAIRDVESTQALADKLLKSIEGVGLKPRRLSSCASLARLKYAHALQKVRPPDYVNRIFERTFFGGRIEVRQLGTLGRTRLFDIHSAYPSVLASLSSPIGRVIESNENTWTFQNPTYGAYEIIADVPLSFTWGPLAYRQANRVIYPVGVVKTHCGLPAIRSLRKAGVGFRVLRAYEIFGHDETPFFSDVEKLYLARKDPVLGLALKLVLNSTYGLMAEQKYYNVESELETGGARWVGGKLIKTRTRYGKLTNYILAAHITESIRMKLWEALHAAGKRAIFAATDSILLRDNAGLPVGPGLGEWGLKGSYSSGTVLGCGRYLLRGLDGGLESHLRGFPARPETWDKLRRTKRRFAMLKSLETETLRVWASSLSLDLNVLRDFPRRLEISDDKRYWPSRFKRLCDAFAGSIDSEPFIVGTPKLLEKTTWNRPPSKKPLPISATSSTPYAPSLTS